MDERAAALPGHLVSDALLDREFEQRLAEASTLAFRVAYGVLRRREDAEDVAQEAAVRAYRRFGSLRDRERFRPWLVRIAWRLAVDRRRSERRREVREQAVGEGTQPGPTAEDVAAARQTQERVWRALDELPEKLRVVMVLAAIEGHGTREVAALLCVPEGTVKSRLHDARRRMLEILR
ncbi:MAG: RNA polymerase subunit sigma-24 [Acidobacteria bacterium]|nr:MAG: RNA polymerase subunit sigma-24 [Acidobacteriota bacterium]